MKLQLLTTVPEVPYLRLVLLEVDEVVELKTALDSSSIDVPRNLAAF